VTHHDDIDGRPPGTRDGRATEPAAAHDDRTAVPEPADATRVPGLGPDASVREITRAARAAFLGTDLIQSGPGLWPFGQRARTRRDRNRQAAADARRRRAAFQQAFEAPRQDSPPPRSRPGPVDRRTHRIVIAALAGLAAAVLAAAVWFGGSPNSHPSSQPAPLPAATTSSPVPVTSEPAPRSPSPSETAAVPPQPPIPSGGVTPITPRPRTTVDPRSVLVVDPPAGDPTPTELATPDGALRAWLARLCPFDYHAPFGTAERRARPAMTDTGWTILDPAQNPGARASWDRTVAARESGRCAQPTALVSPEAPRTPTTAIVIGAVTRVVTPDGGQPYVEQLSEVRIMRQGADQLWRVDLPTEGG
jgi:hypothetical protein